MPFALRSGSINFNISACGDGDAPTVSFVVFFSAEPALDAVLPAGELLLEAPFDWH
jgi:hypothetical protein